MGLVFSFTKPVRRDSRGAGVAAGAGLSEGSTEATGITTAIGFTAGRGEGGIACGAGSVEASSGVTCIGGMSMEEDKFESIFWCSHSFSDVVTSAT